MRPTSSPSTASRVWDALSPASAARSTSPTDSALRLYARLAREAAATESPRAFALEAAQAAAQALRASHCGVTEILADGRRLSVHVHPLARQFSGSVKKIEVDLAAENCLSAAALRLGQTLAAPNLAGGEERDAELQALGICGALVVPLVSQTHTYGALAVYHDGPLPLDAEQTMLVEGLSHLVTSALARCRAQVVVREKLQFEEALHGSMETLLLSVGTDGVIRSANEAGQTIAGFAAADLVGHALASSLIAPEDAGVAARALARCAKDKSHERFETYILTGDGLRKRMAWTAAPLAGGEQPTQALVVTGIDITDRCEAIERAARAEALSQDARRLCRELQDRLRQGEALLDGTAQSRRLPLGVDHDRRARSRRPYPYLQRIAPMRGTAMPDETQFNEWLCHDISSRGFSFITPNQPDYHKIVVAFGTAPSLVYLTADVRHTTKLDAGGRTQFIVGCRYTGRISKKDRAHT